MKRIYPITTIVSAIGYLTSLVLYGLTFNDVNSLELPIYSPLASALFGIWLIAVLKLSFNPELKNLKIKNQLNPVAMFKIMFNGTPSWIQVVAVFSFVFAMVSFIVISINQPGVVSIIDGKKVLHNHGDIIKELTEKEYQHALAIEARQFLGHFLAFFGVGTAILHPEKNEETISNVA